MPPKECIICSVRIASKPSVSAPYTILECFKCKRFCHSSCTDLRQDDLIFIFEDNRAWFCKSCDELEKSCRYDSPPSNQNSSVSNNAEILEALKDINNRIEDQSDRFKEMVNKIENRIKLLENTLVQMNILKEENVELKKSVNGLEIKLNNMEQQMRSNMIDISGIPLSDNEKTDEVVLNVFNSGLGLNLTKADIVDCFRVKPITFNNVSGRNENDGSHDKNKNKNNNTLSPTIIVKLANTATKIKIFRTKSTSKMNLNTKKLFNTNTSKPIFINENLCKNRRIILNAALNIKRERDYKFAWTRGGTVCMRKDTNSPIHIINCLDDLYNLK